MIKVLRKWTAPWLALALLSMAALAVQARAAAALELRVGAFDGPRHAAAVALRDKLAPLTTLQVAPTADDAMALRDLTGFALVRASSAREAYEGKGRFDKPQETLRTVALLGREVVYLMAKADRTDLAALRGRPVAVAPTDADTLRSLLAKGKVGLAELRTVTVDPLAAAQAGSIDAWLAVDLPGSATAAALAARGWHALELSAETKDRIGIEGWPFQLVKAADLHMPEPANRDVVALASVLVADASVPRALVEDLVDALFPTGAAEAGNVPLLSDAHRKSAAQPVPTALHPGAAASYSRAGPLTGPIQVQVTLWILDVSDIDIGRGTFDADVTLELRWQDARLDVTTLRPFEFINASDVHVEPYGYASHGAWHALNWRIHARLRSAFDVHKYPLDQQRLTIALEHPLQTADELVYRCETRFGSPDVNLRRDRLGPDFHLPDWRLTRVHTEEGNVNYGPSEEFSRYSFVLTIERALLPFLVRDLWPILLMVLVGLAASLVPSEKIDAKLLLTVLALLVAVELQVAHDEQAPHVGYPTLTEYLFLFAYLSIAIAVLTAIVEYRLHDQGRDPAAIRLRKWGALASTLAFLVPAALVTWTKVLH